jgi:2-polyprenyl-3-methyl-5-hydroxy-6-metoxy-1,4-benzoquinol methylase
MNNFIVKIILRLHSFSYNWASFFAKKAGKGIHPKHRLMNYHKFFVDNVSSDDLVLDLGCGNGALTFDLAQKAKKVIGIDINPEKIKLAEENFSAPNIDYLIGDASQYSFDQKFDAIILSNILEHIENRTKLLNKLKSLTSKILIRVPMIDRDWITLYKKELGLKWKSHNSHFIEYTLESFKKEIEQAGLKIKNYSIQFGEIWAILS